MNHYQRLKTVFFSLALLLVLFAIVDLSAGGVFFSPHALSHSSIDQIILWQLRVPRVLALIFAGIGLGVAGSAIQGLLQNPLADPALLGISSGGSFCVVLSMVILPFAHWLPLNLCAWLGCFIAMLVMLAISRFAKGMGIAAVVLGGVALNALFGGAVSLMFVFANQSALGEALMWTLGGVQLPSLYSFVTSALIILLGLSLLWRQSKGLDLMAFGEANAHSMGANPRRLRYCILLGVSLVVSATVVLAGPIAFVGLLAPHVSRVIVGARQKVAMLVSSLVAAIFMLLADALSRFIFYPLNIPLGVVLALIGGPAFLFVLWKVVGRSSC